MLIVLESAMKIFTLLGICAIIFLSIPIVVKLFSKKDTFLFVDKIEENLKCLRNNSKSKIKAKAFIKLMGLNYILVHTLVNKGKKYDDRTQTKRFKECLTNDFVSNITSLEGKYE